MNPISLSFAHTIARATPCLDGLRMLAALVGVLAFVAPLAAHAQDVDSLPSRVGRIANIQGQLYRSLPESADEWAPAVLNDPVAQGENLLTEGAARAEVDYGGGQFRLAAETNLHVSRLDDRQLALFVAQGSVIVRVRYLEPDDSMRVDTPSTQISLNRPGLYRVNVDPKHGTTSVLVREGEADVELPNGAEPVLPGQIAMLTGTREVSFEIRNGGGLDGFDTWSAERDRVYEAPRDYGYVSPQMVGQYDLDSYGDWQTYPEYGAVWFPTVDPEWAPYRFGHWTWLPGFGYTWVDSAPWGYAPFHYGRWAYISGRWGWCPGTFVLRPVWAPALVAWYGGGPWSVGAAGLPVFSWVPLAWGEPFVPWWSGCTSRCYARFNRPYGVNVATRPDPRNVHYANVNAPGGVTAVPASTLVSARPVAINRVQIPRNVAPPPALPSPPSIRPAPVLPGTIRAGSGIPAPVTRYSARPIPSATLTERVPPTPIAPPVPRGRGAASVSPERVVPMPVPPTAPRATERIEPLPRVAPLPQPVRPVPVPPPAPVSPPVRVPEPSLPLPRTPAPPVPGVSPAPPAAVVPTPVRPVEPK
ncbi:MAG TPA: DUF6600 domain-containing protein [Casimicrobiaceae bacterium]|nr:DUF6600 domain-containing protein [Casimicrobiaceae bacterium]